MFFSIKWPYNLYFGPGLQNIGLTCIKIRNEMICLPMPVAVIIHICFSSLSRARSSAAFPSPVCLEELVWLRVRYQIVGAHKIFHMDFYPLAVLPWVAGSQQLGDIRGMGEAPWQQNPWRRATQGCVGLETTSLLPLVIKQTRLC